MQPSSRSLWRAGVGGGVAALALLLAGCLGLGRSSRQATSDADAEAERLPLRVDAVPALRGDTLGAEVVAFLPAGALGETAAGGSRRASVDWVLQTASGVDLRRDAADTVEADGPEGSQAIARLWWIPLPAGTARFTVTAIDQALLRRASRSVTVAVPDPAEGPSIGRPRVERRRLDGTRDPLDATALPAFADSLVAVAQLVGLSGGAVRATLERLPVAVGPAPPPQAESAEHTSSTPTSEVGPVLDVPVAVTRSFDTATITLPPLEDGVYRLRVRDSTSSGPQAERLIAVRRGDYPRTTRLGDLLGPLAYLATPSEAAALSAARAPAAQRRVFDRFWGRHLRDRRDAAATVRTYYERVEEANRRFIERAEGWATDRGMIYIVFGAPDRVLRTPEGETWEYQGGRTPPFAFRRIDDEADGLGPTFVLLRDEGYAPVWAQAQRLWRTGRTPR